MSSVRPDDPHGIYRPDHGLSLCNTLFVSAALLFVAQPMLGKLILPILGGSPAVWNSCVMFFRPSCSPVLLAHAVATRLALRRQVAVQLAFLALGVLTFPSTVRGDASAAVAWPVATVLNLLTQSIGLPLLAIAATAPLLQRWLELPASRGRRSLFPVRGEQSGQPARALRLPVPHRAVAPAFYAAKPLDWRIFLVGWIDRACGWQPFRSPAPPAMSHVGQPPEASEPVSSRPRLQRAQRARWLAFGSSHRA